MASSLERHDSHVNPITLWAGMHDLAAAFADKKHKGRQDSDASDEVATPTSSSENDIP